MNGRYLGYLSMLMGLFLEGLYSGNSMLCVMSHLQSSMNNIYKVALCVIVYVPFGE